MNPSARRIAILIIELMVFFMVTAFTTYFISHAGALNFASGDAPPAEFPVIAYDGDRARPAAANYLVVPWSGWEDLAAKRSGASLLLPERSATVRIGDAGEASFRAVEVSESRQAVELTWRAGGGEQQVRYVAQARSVEPLYYRTISTNTLMVGAAIGFVTGLFVGRVMRRRWLAQPGYFAPSPPKSRE
jgi:hypothetical protein